VDPPRQDAFVTGVTRRCRVRAVVQRVSRAKVTVASEIVGEIGPGLCVLLGVTHDDTERDAETMAGKLAELRIFPDDDGRMNRSVTEAGGEVLVVSQFTLYADTRRGDERGPTAAAPGDVAEPLVDRVTDALAARGLGVATGRFGADMDVELVNDGPVTLIVEVPAHR
jgi:D-tyrosyl-tRNA(Tyr) deacylase